MNSAEGGRLSVICVAGPTGAGKSALALSLARAFHGEIINADSRQVYKDFPLITAQPTEVEKNVCPHALYGFLETEKRISAAVWAVMAVTAIHKARQAERLPILVGGTGLYMRTLFDGIAQTPPVPEAISARLARECDLNGTNVLHARLQESDPACAARIHPNDRQRIIRALEVYEASGKPLSWWQEHHAKPGITADVLRLGVKMPLADLTPLLARRIDGMIEAGAPEEAKKALENCPDGTAPGWSGIGCAELYAVLHGKLGMDEAKALWLANTRAYAKRQLTWFRADNRISWFTPEQTDKAHEAVAAFLKRIRSR